MLRHLQKFYKRNHICLLINEYYFNLLFLIMKIISRNFKNETKGSITMKPTDEEDIWYAYNLIRAGDMIKMKVFRKVTN